MTDAPATSFPEEDDAREHRSKEHRNRRLRRHGRRAYIRSVYFLPSMATLGNAICGFAAMYVAAIDKSFSTAAYLIFGAMLFDAIDGRLARFTRHTTDFGGQLDSLADVVSFGVAPAFLSLLLIKSAYAGNDQVPLPTSLSKFIWSIGALYMSCAALRLARFNVSNEHGEQHHFSFLGLPSPAAGGTVAAWVLMQQDLMQTAHDYAGYKIATVLSGFSTFCTIVLPGVVLLSGLLMISHVRYPHLVNQYLRGKRSLGRLIAVLVGVLVLIMAHQYAISLGMMSYIFLGLFSAVNRARKKQLPPK